MEEIEKIEIPSLGLDRDLDRALKENLKKETDPEAEA